MIKTERRYRSQLAIIGTGLAGFAASLFARSRGITVAQVGNTGSVAYTSGHLDLLGYHAGQRLDSPWAGLERLRCDEPGHPLSRIGDEPIRQAFSGFIGELSRMGVGYSLPREENLLALMPAGTLKPTFSLPNTMLPGAGSLSPGTRVLVVDFEGLEGFSARELAVNLEQYGLRLSAARLAFPGSDRRGVLYPEVMARELEIPETRKRLAGSISAVMGSAELVGMPAVMGVHAPDRVHADLERLVGVPLFEIPTMPPAVPGIRLRELFERKLPGPGMTLVAQQKVRRLEVDRRGAVLHLQDSYGPVVIEAEAALLATGRFLSGGLKADRRGVTETLLDIPVTQPAGRAGWYRPDYFDRRGHEINRAGIEVDARFRPLGRNGEPLGERLFAAGSLLAGHDWIRQRCGAGVAIATAHEAVKAAAELVGADG